MLRETPKSLSGYFTVGGIVVMLGALGSLIGDDCNLPMISAALTGLTFLFGACIYYIGFNLAFLLAHKPDWPVRFAFSASIISLALTVLELDLSNSEPRFVFGFRGVVTILLLYLWVQLKRLAAAAETRFEDRTLT